MLSQVDFSDTKPSENSTLSFNGSKEASRQYPSLTLLDRHRQLTEHSASRLPETPSTLGPRHPHGSLSALQPQDISWDINDKVLPEVCSPALLLIIIMN